MKFLSLFFLFFTHYSYAAAIFSANCGKAFVDRSINRQFTETIDRSFSTHQGILEQKHFETIIKAFNGAGRGRKGTLQYLVDAGYLAPSVRNPLFSYILNRPSSEVVRLIEKEPDLLYEGTLLDLPPFFLIVFVGDKPAMVSSIGVDKTLTNSRNPLDEVPLHYTIDPEIAMGLLYYNAKPNEQDKKGRVALHNNRNPETVETILFYKADPTIRDRSGVSVTKYHEEVVRDQEIIDLLVQAREDQKSMKIAQNNHRIAFMNGKSVEQMERIEAERRVAEARRIEEEAQRTAEVRRIEEETRRRTAEAGRVAVETRETGKIKQEAKRQAQIESQKKIEEQKNELISEIATEMTSAIIIKLMVNGLIQSLTSGTFQYPASYVKDIKMRASSIIVLQRELEDKLGEKVALAVTDLFLRSVQTDAAIDKMESYIQGIESELAVTLKDEISHLSLGVLRKKVRKAQRQSVKLNEMAMQLLPFEKFREGFVRRLAADFDRHQIPRPASIREFLARHSPQIHLSE